MKLRTKLGAVMVLALILGWIYLMRSPTKPTTKEDLQKSELRMLRKAAAEIFMIQKYTTNAWNLSIQKFTKPTRDCTKDWRPVSQFSSMTNE